MGRRNFCRHCFDCSTMASCLLFSRCHIHNRTIFLHKPSRTSLLPRDLACSMHFPLTPCPYPVSSPVRLRAEPNTNDVFASPPRKLLGTNLHQSPFPLGSKKPPRIREKQKQKNPRTAQTRPSVPPSDISPVSP